MPSEPLWDSFELIRDHYVPRRFHVRSCDSTMSRADAMLRQEHIQLPFVLTTDHQRAGQGTHGRRWEDKPATALMATLMIPVSGADPLLPIRMGLAVCDLLSGLGVPHLALKWPNDCLCGDRKIAGILCRYGAQRAAIGIGINVTAAPELDFATSIGEALGSNSGITPEGIRGPLIDRCSDFLGVSSEHLRAMWQKYLWRRGKPVRVAPIGGDPFEATVVDIAADGALIVDRDLKRVPGTGSTDTVRAGRISLP